MALVALYQWVHNAGFGKAEYTKLAAEKRELNQSFKRATQNAKNKEV